MVDGSTFSNSIGTWIVKSILEDDDRLSDIDTSYVSGSTSNIAASSYQNVFKNDDHSNCPVSSCTMSGGSSASLGSYPYPITYTKDVPLGYDESYTITCTTTTSKGSTTLD